MLPAMWIWLLAALALGYALARTCLGYPRPARRFGALVRHEAAFLAAAAEATFPAGGGIAPSGLDADLPAYTDRFLCAAHPRMRFLMHLLFFLVEHATLFFPAPGRGGMRRFSSLSAEQRTAVLEGWRRSRLFPRRLVFASLRAILTMGYFAHPSVLRELGLAPYAIRTPVCEADLLYPRVGAPRAAIALSRTDLTPPSDGTPIPLDAPLHPAYREGAP
jgi:hypothetical protein